jgi:hypothetical protein
VIYPRMSVWPTIALLALSACGYSKSDDDDDEDSDDASEYGPTDACTRLIECASEVAPGDQELLAEVYGTEGDCWDGAEEALACTRACEAELAAYRATHSDHAACWPNGFPDAESFFADGTEWSWPGCQLNAGWPTLEVDTYFYAEDEQDFMTDFRLRYNGEQQLSNLNVPCTLSGPDFSCGPSTTTAGEWDATGTFNGDLQTGTILLTITDGEGPHSCEVDGEAW